MKPKCNYIFFFILLKFIIPKGLHCSALAELSPEDAAKQAMYSERERITHLIAVHLNDVITHTAKEYSWLPGYYLKSGSDRIAGAARLQRCIEKHSLKLVKVPEKWLCPITEQQLQKCPDTVCANRYRQDPHVVVAQKFKGVAIGAGPLIQFDQMKELYCLLQHAKEDDGPYYSDVHDEGNLLMCDDGKIAIIDTEARSFRDSWGLLGLEKLLDYKCLTNDSRVFIQQQLARMRKEQLDKSMKHR